MKDDFSKDSAKNDFSKGAVWRHIVSLAVPLTVAQLVQVLYNVVDRIYIGHLPGTNGLALTGIGLTFPIITFVTAFTQLFGMGGAPLCSIARGAGDTERGETIMGTSMTLLLGASFLIMALCYCFKKPVLYAFGASDQTYGYANDYLTVYLLGTVFSMVGVGMNFYINAQGFARMGMLTTVLGAVVNIALDPLFIFVFDLGVRGAAMATVIAQGVSCAWVLFFLCGKKAILRIRPALLRVRLSITKEILSLGLSGFIMAATNCTCQIVCNRVLSIYGGDLYVGIMTVINSIREIFGLPVSGITNGSQPVLGYNYGAKEYRRVKKGIVFTALSGFTYTALAWLLILFFPKPLFRMFSSDTTMIAQGVEALHIYFFGYVFMSFQFCGQSTFVALGRAKFAVFFSLLRKAFIVVPLTILLPRWISPSVNGVFLAEPISNAIGGLACFITMLCTVWRSLSAEEKKARLGEGTAGSQGARG